MFNKKKTLMVASLMLVALCSVGCTEREGRAGRYVADLLFGFGPPGFSYVEDDYYHDDSGFDFSFELIGDNGYDGYYEEDYGYGDDYYYDDYYEDDYYYDDWGFDW